MSTIAELNKQATVIGLMLITHDGNDRRGKRGHSLSTDHDCRLLISLDVQLWIQRYGLLGVKHRHAGPVGVS